MVFFASCDQDIDQTCNHEYETTSIGADCEHGVMNTKVCAKCGDRTDTYTPPSGHSFEKTVIAPTCSDSGYTEYKCDCGFSYKAEIVSAKGHYYKETVTSPTCTTAGYTTYTCRNCAHTYIGATVAPVDHDLECKITDSTCNAPGFASYTCKNCDYSYTEITDSPKDHDFDCKITDPTCSEQGYAEYLCKNCGIGFISDYCQPTGHNFSSEVLLPTCTDSGNTTYTCTDCFYSFVSDFVDPLGHDFGTEIISVSGCTVSGEIKHSCICGYSYSEIIPPLGHNFDVEVVPPTVSDMGYTEFSCDCGFNYVGNYRFYSEILDNAYAGNDQVVAHGIDISKWNHTVNSNGVFEPLDWVALKEAGVDYVILKIGSTPRDGAGGIEPTFEMDYYGAKAAGIDVGVYYFTYAESVSEIRMDAEYILEWLKGKQFEYPIYLDLENSPNENYLPSEIAAPILTEMCLTFFSELQKNGYYTGLYVNNEFLFNILQTENMIELFEIWYARYPSVDPYTWNPNNVDTFVWDAEKYGAHLGMWQYSMTGQLPPISTDVDFNYAYKDYPTLIKLHGFNGLVTDSLTDEDETLEGDTTEDNSTETGENTYSINETA